MDPMNHPPETETAGTIGAGGTGKKPGVYLTVLLMAACAFLCGGIPTGLLSSRQPGAGFTFTKADLVPAVVCGISAVLCFLIFGRMVRGIRPLVIPACALILACAYAGPYTAVAGLAVVLTAALGAFLVFARGMHILLLFPAAAVSYLCAFLLVRDPVTALLALLPYPCAAFLAHANSDHAPRAEAVARASAGLVISAGLLFAVMALIREGHIDLSRIVDAVDGLRGSLKQLLVTAGMGQIDEKIAAAAADTMVNLLPGLVLVGFEAFGYLIQLTEAGLSNGEKRHYGRRILSPAESDTFRMSPVSGVIFLLCTLIQLFGSGSVFFTVLSNISAVLMIPMIAAGIRYLVLLYRSPRARFRIFPIVLAGLSVLMYGFGAIPLLLEVIALLGAADAIFRPIRDKLDTMREDP